MLVIDIDEVNLLFQLGVFIVLLSGYPRFRIYKKINMHGRIMVLATALNTISIIAVMIPLAIVERTDIPYALTYAHPFLFVTHTIIGTVAWAIALFLSIRWMRYRDMRKCFVRRTMRAAFALWTISFALGAATYIIHYLPIVTI